MIAYALMVYRRRYDRPAVCTINLVSLDLKQVIEQAKNVHQLGFSFDYESTISVYKMEVGTVITSRALIISDGFNASFPIIFQRTKDTDDEWTDQWLNENAKAEFYSTATQTASG